MGASIRDQETSGHVKGAALREALRWMRGRLGDHQAESVVARIPSPHRDRFDPAHEAFGILASTWYPAPVVHALCDALPEGLSLPEQSALAREFSRALMEATLKGLYRFLFEQLVSPERFAALAPRVWRTYFDTGERRTVIVSPAKHDCTVRDWRGHHRFLCLVQMHATTYVYEAAGCRGVATVGLSCVSDGATVCEWTTTWSPSAGRLR